VPARWPTPASLVGAGYDAVADRYAALEQEDAVWPRSRHVAELARQDEVDARRAPLLLQPHPQAEEALLRAADRG